METNKTIATVYKSLSDETRLSIVCALASEKQAVTSKEIIGDCATALKLSQPTMSHHFQTLVAAGVLLESKVGVEKYYQLNRPLLTAAGINLKKLVATHSQ